MPMANLRAPAFLPRRLFLRGLACLAFAASAVRSEEHTSELQSQSNLVCRLLLEKKKKKFSVTSTTYNKPTGWHVRICNRVINVATSKHTNEIVHTGHAGPQHSTV